MNLLFLFYMNEFISLQWIYIYILNYFFLYNFYDKNDFFFKFLISNDSNNHLNS